MASSALLCPVHRRRVVTHLPVAHQWVLAHLPVAHQRVVTHLPAVLPYSIHYRVVPGEVFSFSWI